MRVLHLVTSMNPGGVERWLLDMLGEIPRSNCAMDICCKAEASGAWGAQAEALGATVHICPLRPSHVGFVRGFRRILREWHYDLVNCHLGTYSALPVMIAHELGIPVINTFHNHEFPAETRFTRLPIVRTLRHAYQALNIRYAIKNSDMLVCVSEGVQDRLIPTVDHVRAKSRVIHHGVRIPKIPTDAERASFRESLEFPSDALVLGHVGSFNERKNHAGILRIFQRVLDDIPSARLILIGEGVLRGAIERRVSEMGIEDKTRFLGYRNDAPSLLALCDIFLFPSRIEGFGIAPLEANAAGLAVVGSRIPGLTEAVEDGVTAILHPYEDESSMAASTIELLSAPERRRAMGDAGRTRARQHFSLQATARKLTDVFSQCLAGPRTTALDRGRTKAEDPSMKSSSGIESG